MRRIAFIALAKSILGESCVRYCGEISELYGGYYNRSTGTAMRVNRLNESSLNALQHVYDKIVIVCSDMTSAMIRYSGSIHLPVYYTYDIQHRVVHNTHILRYIVGGIVRRTERYGGVWSTHAEAIAICDVFNSEIAYRCDVSDSLPLRRVTCITDVSRLTERGVL